jgi:hypothetical protein
VGGFPHAPAALLLEDKTLLVTEQETEMIQTTIWDFGTEEKFLTLAMNPNLNRSVRSPVSIPITLSELPTAI